MRRHYCWTAILATWTILATLRNALAEEQPLLGHTERLLVRDRTSHDATRVLVFASNPLNVIRKQTNRYERHEDQRKPSTSYQEDIPEPEDLVAAKYRTPQPPSRQSQRKRDDQRDKEIRDEMVRASRTKRSSYKSKDNGVNETERKIYRKESKGKIPHEDDTERMAKFDESFDEREGREGENGRLTDKWATAGRERQTLVNGNVGSFSRTNRFASHSTVNYADEVNQSLERLLPSENEKTRARFTQAKRVKNVDITKHRVTVTGVDAGKTENRGTLSAEKHDTEEFAWSYVSLHEQHDPHSRAIQEPRKSRTKGKNHGKEMQEIRGDELRQKTSEIFQGHSYVLEKKLLLRQRARGNSARPSTERFSSNDPANPQEEDSTIRPKNRTHNPSTVRAKVENIRGSWKIRERVAIKNEMELAQGKRSLKIPTERRAKDIARLLYGGKRGKRPDGNFKDDFRKSELRTTRLSLDNRQAGGRTKRELIKSSSLTADEFARTHPSNQALPNAFPSLEGILPDTTRDSPTKSLENHPRNSPRIQSNDGGRNKKEARMKSTLTSTKLSTRSESAGYNPGGIFQRNRIDEASTIESDNVEEPSGTERSSIATDIIANRLAQSTAIKIFQGEAWRKESREPTSDTSNDRACRDAFIKSHGPSGKHDFADNHDSEWNSTGRNFNDTSKSHRLAVTSVAETKFKVSPSAGNGSLTERLDSSLKYVLSKANLVDMLNQSDPIFSAYPKIIDGPTATEEYFPFIPGTSSWLQMAEKNFTELDNDGIPNAIVENRFGLASQPDQRIHLAKVPTNASVDDGKAEERTNTVDNGTDDKSMTAASMAIDSKMAMTIINDLPNNPNASSNRGSFLLEKISPSGHEGFPSRRISPEIEGANKPRIPNATTLAPEIFRETHNDIADSGTGQAEKEALKDAYLSANPATTPSTVLHVETVITAMDRSIGQENELSRPREQPQTEIATERRQISNEDRRDQRGRGIKRNQSQKNFSLRGGNCTSEHLLSVGRGIAEEGSTDRSIPQNASGNVSLRPEMYFPVSAAERFVADAEQRDRDKPTPRERKRIEQSRRGSTIHATQRDVRNTQRNKEKQPSSAATTVFASLPFQANRSATISDEPRKTIIPSKRNFTSLSLSTSDDEKKHSRRDNYDVESKGEKSTGETTQDRPAMASKVSETSFTQGYYRHQSRVKQEEGVNTATIGRTEMTPTKSSIVRTKWQTTRKDSPYLDSSPASTKLPIKVAALTNKFLRASTLAVRSGSYQRRPTDERMLNDEDTAKRSTTDQPVDRPTESADLGNQLVFTLSSVIGPTLSTASGNHGQIDSIFQLAADTANDHGVYPTLRPGNPSTSDAWYGETGNVSMEKLDNNSSHESTQIDQWPVKHSAVVEGDLVLGGLMMVHEREDTITCGPVMPQGGVQALEAMLYTLDKLNEGEGIVPGVKIGAHILDDCDKDTYGLEMAVDFIKGSISNIDGAEYHCNRTAVRKVISGVVGAASSVTSIQVANLLRLFRIPQVSFFSTSPELSNKQRFEYFTRTIPSDHYQVKAMVDIVRKMGWSYVSIIYEESNYGIKAFEELEELLKKHQICIAIKEKLVKDSGVAEETAYDNIVLKLLTKPRARGCIIFGSDQEVAGVMRAVRRCNATGAFSWIGSDGWSARGLVSNGNEPEVEGTLSVQPQANPVKGFHEYFLNLTVENNRRNPWFVEFWEDHFQCRYPNASRTPYNQKYTRPCTTKERLTEQNTAFEDQLQFVSDAVMAFAYAFRDMHMDLCGGQAGLCDAMKPTKGTELLKYLRKVDFEGLSGDKFKFDKNGDGPARYNIIHFKQTSSGKYEWVKVGKYLEGELRLNMSEIQFKLSHPQPPESVCSLPCEVGQAKKYVEGERCCWHCFNCTQYQVRDPEDETQCIVCRQGTVPDETHSTCRDIPEEFLRPESGWAIGAMSFSATGILVTLFVGGVFLRHNDTPVVRASGRELSYVLLSGILLCYLVTFALVLRPSDIVCGIQRFAAGFCFTVVYAALLTKTNRILRIFNASKRSAKRPSFISPRSQLIICSGLVGVQILINGVWMVIDPARAMHHYPTREDNLLVCNSYIDASYMIAFTYPIILILVCTIYAVLTRKTPEAFNESKHIGFTMYTTCVIWLAFVPLYFGTGNHVALRITSMSVTISLSASVTIACLFSPKLYIILIRPERNVRQSMMPTRYSTTKNSAVSGTNASNMMAHVTLTAVTCNQKDALKKHAKTTTDGSTQSEYHELEPMDQKNGKPAAIAVVSRSTQTHNNNNEMAKDGAKEAKENPPTSSKQFNRIGNGPVSQSDVLL